MSDLDSHDADKPADENAMPQRKMRKRIPLAHRFEQATPVAPLNNDGVASSDAYVRVQTLSSDKHYTAYLATLMETKKLTANDFYPFPEASILNALKIVPRIKNSEKIIKAWKSLPKGKQLTLSEETLLRSLNRNDQSYAHYADYLYESHKMSISDFPKLTIPTLEQIVMKQPSTPALFEYLVRVWKNHPNPIKRLTPHEEKLLRSKVTSFNALTTSETVAPIPPKETLIESAPELTDETTAELNDQSYTKYVNALMENKGLTTTDFFPIESPTILHALHSIPSPDVLEEIIAIWKSLPNEHQRLNAVEEQLLLSKRNANLLPLEEQPYRDFMRTLFKEKDINRSDFPSIHALTLFNVRRHPPQPEVLEELLTAWKQLPDLKKRLTPREEELLLQKVGQNKSVSVAHAPTLTVLAEPKHTQDKPLESIPPQDDTIAPPLELPSVAVIDELTHEHSHALPPTPPAQVNKQEHVPDRPLESVLPQEDIIPITTPIEPTPVAVLDESAHEHSPALPAPLAQVNERKLEPKKSKLNAPSLSHISDDFHRAIGHYSDKRFFTVSLMIDQLNRSDVEYKIQCNDYDGQTLHRATYQEPIHEPSTLDAFKATLKASGIKEFNIKVMYKTKKGNYLTAEELAKKAEKQNGFGR